MIVPSITFLKPGHSPEMIWAANIYTAGESRQEILKWKKRDGFLRGRP